MITKLEQIEKMEDLITYISAFGRPTDQESICRMQDIVGHTALEDLIKFATDDGTKIEDGNKWSTGRRGTQAITMNLLFAIWNWEEATNFYNRYVNQIAIKNREDAAKVKNLTENLTKREDELEKTGIELAKMLTEQAKLKRDLEKAEAEILKLKAKLFDYMTA